MWNQLGLAIALAVAAVAWHRSRSQGGYYDEDVYGMTPATHRRYALASLSFAFYFGAAWRLGGTVQGLGGLTVYAVVVILYGASFLRGAEEDEGTQGK
jgi:hypothetical protein